MFWSSTTWFTYLNCVCAGKKASSSSANRNIDNNDDNFDEFLEGMFPWCFTGFVIFMLTVDWVTWQLNAMHVHIKTIDRIVVRDRHCCLIQALSGTDTVTTNVFVVAAAWPVWALHGASICFHVSLRGVAQDASLVHTYVTHRKVSVFLRYLMQYLHLSASKSLCWFSFVLLL